MLLGKINQGLMPSLFLLFAVPAAGQTVKHYRYLDNIKQAGNEVIASNHSIIINYSLPALDLESLSNEAGRFYRLSVPGHLHSTEVGKPEMPVLSRMISVPSGTSAEIKLSEIKTSRFKPSLRRIKGLAYPAQASETKLLQQRKPPFAIDKDAYAMRKFLRTDTVRIEPVGKARKENLANVLIYPVNYNPRSNTLEIITSMKIEITFVPSGTGESKALFPESAFFKETLDKSLLNYDPADIITGYTEKPVSMVIITDTSFTRDLQPFFRWKTQKGFRLEVLYKGATLDGNDFATLKEKVAGIYNSSTSDNPPPEFLLIIGDANKVPYYSSGSYTDMYYGEFDGNGDYIPDMFIGRLPVKDTAELRAVVRKIIQYEKFEFADTNKFYKNSIMTSGFNEGHALYMDGQTRYALENYLIPANNITEHHFYSGDITLATKTSLINLINNGASFLNYSGHGQTTGWLMHSLNTDTANFYTSNFQRLRNRNMYPFIIGNACYTSAFYLTSAPSFGNRIVTAADKGAIGYIGCADESFWDEDFYWAVGTGTPSANPTYATTGLGAYDRLFHTHGEPASDWYITMGQVNYAGNLAVSSSTTTSKKYYWENYNLVGDPSIIPIIGNPGTINVALPDTLPDGIKSITLTGDRFTYAAVSHFDTLWDASFLSPSGSVTLELPGLSNDSCLFVITGQNKKPLIKKVYFSTIKNEFINLNKCSINDASANNNGYADFGETLSLRLAVGNLGLAGASDLRAIISSESDWVTILNDSVYIGSLGPGSETMLDNNLMVRIAEEVPDKGIVTFDLVLRDNHTEKHYKIDINVHAPQLEIINCVLDDSDTGDGDLTADPGETFNLVFNVRNTGSSNTSGVLNIISPNSEITVLEPGKGSGIIEYGKMTKIPVRVRLLQASQAGTTITINSLLNCTPYFTSRDFTFRVGKFRESFETSSFALFPWINTSLKPWTITGINSWDGIISARSGAISHGESSLLALRANYLSNDTLKFYYTVSSERNYDYLIFRLNNTEIFKKSGELPWQEAKIPVTAGYNKMEWLYKKDQSVSSGSDCAMIDKIDFARNGTVNYIRRDLVAARIISPVNKEHLGREPVILKVLNMGPDTIRGFNLAYNVNKGLTVTQHFENALIPFGDSVNVTFNSPVNLSHYGSYDIEVFGFANNDDYLLNDTLKTNIMNNELDGPLQVSPNPFVTEINVVMNSEFDGTAYFTLFSSTGKKLWQEKTEIVAGTSAAVLNKLPVLPPAVYYLKVEFPGFSKTVHLVKLKN